MDNKQKLPISCVILTYNEELNIIRTLESISEWVGEIFIVDSFSNDKTLELAKRFAAQIYQRKFDSHVGQWDWAFKNLPFSFPWCLALDADQVVSPKLGEELKKIFNQSTLDIDGFYIKRRQIFQGKWIRFGGYYPKYLLRLFKINEVFCDERELVDKHFYVKGKTAVLKNDIIEENYKENNISFWIEKHNRYSDLLAREELSFKNGLYPSKIKPSLWGNPDQSALYLKRIYYRLPLFIRPLIYFFYRYFLKFGFLDGKKGMEFHFLQGLWYRLIVDCKIKELIRKNEG